MPELLWAGHEKKTLTVSEQKEAERAAWRKTASRLSSGDLVFVDETGSHIAMTPLYAYAPRGQRAVGKVPHNYGAIMTLIASLSLSGMGPAFILDGATDSLAFEIYIEQVKISTRPVRPIVWATTMPPISIGNTKASSASHP